MTRRTLVIASIAVPCALALVWAAARSLSPSPADATKIEHQKLQRLLADLEITKRALQERVKNLIEVGQGVESFNIYQGIDLSNIDGIHIARQRLKLFTVTYVEMAAATERQWTEMEQLVKANDLDEPFASRLKEAFSSEQTEDFPKFRAWFASARDDAASVTRLLDVAESDLGKTQWKEGHLTSSDKFAAADVLAAQIGVAVAENHLNTTGSATRNNRSRTIGSVLSALHELEKSMTRHESVYDETNPKSKP